MAHLKSNHKNTYKADFRSLTDH